MTTTYSKLFSALSLSLIKFWSTMDLRTKYAWVQFMDFQTVMYMYFIYSFLGKTSKAIYSPVLSLKLFKWSSN